MNKFLEGKRIYLRSFCKADIPIWFDWFNDPHITAYMNKGIFPNTELIQEEHFNFISKSKNDLQLAIILKEHDQLIGTIGIHEIDWIHRQGDVSILIADKSQWGNRIATEAISLIVQHAFIKMNLKRLTAGMAVKNEGAKKCFENNNFILEGTRRKHRFCQGEYVDIYLLGLLREEWEQKK